MASHDSQNALLEYRALRHDVISRLDGMAARLTAMEQSQGGSNPTLRNEVLSRLDGMTARLTAIEQSQSTQIQAAYLQSLMTNTSLVDHTMNYGDSFNFGNLPQQAGPSTLPPSLGEVHPPVPQSNVQSTVHHGEVEQGPANGGAQDQSGGWPVAK